jgi:hypothetical protein
MYKSSVMVRADMEMAVWRRCKYWGSSYFLDGYLR